MKEKLTRFFNKISALNCPQTYYRIAAFILISILVFGANFAYDNPAALENELLKTLKISKTEYQLLYSITSWPNVFFPIVGGYFLDKVIGYRIGTIIFSGVVVLAQGIFLLGSAFNLFWLMCVGRFFYGIGTENLTVTQFTYAGRWFKGRQITIIFGAILTFNRLGSVLDYNVTQVVYNAVALRFPNLPNLCLGLSYLVGFLLCTTSLIVAIILAVVDKGSERHIEPIKKADKRYCPSLRDFKFPINLWLVFIIMIFSYSSVFSFITLAPVFFQVKYGYTSTFASFTNSTFFIMITAFSAILGILLDRVGLNLIMILLSWFFLVMSHSILTFTFWTPILAMVCLGFGFTIMLLAIWPLSTYLLNSNQLGLANGCAIAALNLGDGLFAIIAGVILDEFGYFTLEVFIIFLSLFGLFWSIVLFASDRLQGGVLNEWGPSRRKEKIIVIDTKTEFALIQSSNEGSVEEFEEHDGLLVD